MQQAHRPSTLARLSQVLLPRVPARTLRGTVAALGLALLVGVAVAALALGGQLSGSGQGDAPTLGAALAPAPDYTSDLGTEFDPFVIGSSRVRYTPSVPAALPSAYTGACRSDLAGCVPEERLIPGVSAPTAPVGTGRQQAELYAIEVRDNGAGTTSGDGGPCHVPGRPCNR